VKRFSLGRILLVSALGLSLVANFFLAGYVVKTVRDRFGGEALGFVARSYPPAFRDAFRTAMRENRPQTRRALGELRRAHLALAEALSATPRDEAAVAAAFERVVRASDDAQALVQSYLRGAAASMPPRE
jgi:uncharacterized membrane protein